MVIPSDSIDPLEAKSANATAAAQAALKREIENILCSYVGWFDPFAEIIQNALDSVEERAKAEPKSYKPTLRIIIDIPKNSLTVSDNGTGLSKEKYRQFLAPSFSFKSGKTRGHKGVGATFLAYGYNFIQIATRTADYEHVGKMENARKWLTDANPASNPLIIPDKGGCLDPAFAGFDKGVSITIRFDNTTVPGDLRWLKAESADVWKDILLIKTGLGAILGPLNISVQLIIRPEKGAESTLEFKETEYHWPHQIVKKSKSLLDVQKKSDELHGKHGKNYHMPPSFRNLDCLYETFQPKQISTVITLSTEEQDIVNRYAPTLYLCYTNSARVWSDYNESLNLRGNIDILKPGHCHPVKTC